MGVDYEYCINIKFLFFICCGKIRISLIDLLIRAWFITLLEIELSVACKVNPPTLFEKLIIMPRSVWFKFVKKTHYIFRLRYHDMEYGSRNYQFDEENDVILVLNKDIMNYY